MQIYLHKYLFKKFIGIHTNTGEYSYIFSAPILPIFSSCIFFTGLVQDINPDIAKVYLSVFNNKNSLCEKVLILIYEEIRQTVTLFVSQNWQKIFLGPHLSDTFFLNLYTLYYTRKQLNNRKWYGEKNILYERNLIVIKINFIGWAFGCPFSQKHLLTRGELRRA